MNSVACWKMISAIAKKNPKQTTHTHNNNNTTTTKPRAPGCGWIVILNGIIQSQSHFDAALEQRPGEAAGHWRCEQESQVEGLARVKARGHKIVQTVWPEYWNRYVHLSYSSQISHILKFIVLPLAFLISLNQPCGYFPLSFMKDNYEGLSVVSFYKSWVSMCLFRWGLMGD